MKIRLKDRTSAEKPGTTINHFGVPFVVQKDKTLVAYVSQDMGETMLSASRVLLIKDEQEEEEPEGLEESDEPEELEDSREYTKKLLQEKTVDQLCVILTNLGRDLPKNKTEDMLIKRILKAQREDK